MPRSYIAARRSRGVLDAMVPIFLICSSPKRRFVERVRDLGVTDVIVRPMSPNTAVRKLRVALEAPRPFIKVGDFFGPDRRAGQRPPFNGDDRRDLPDEDQVPLKAPEPERDDSDLTFI